MTVSNAIKQGSTLLNNEERPHHIATLILAFVLKVEKEWLLINDDFNLAEEKLKEFKELLRQYESGKPLAYLTKSKEFYGLDFFVDESVLIPRPETELLIEEITDIVQKNYTKSVSILDVGTGSGNIAIALAKNIAVAEITAVDVDNAALQVAQFNAEKHAVDVKFMKSDLLTSVAGRNFDIVVANLPYIGEQEYCFVSKETYAHEPHLSLFGGADGLQLYKKMFQQFDDLNVNFRFLLGEFGFLQTEPLSELLIQKFDQRFEIKKDLAGIDRYFVVNSI